MSQLIEKNKVIAVLAPKEISTSTSSSAIEIEVYNDDAIVTLQLGTFVSTANVKVSIEASVTTAEIGFKEVGSFETATAGGIASIGVNIANEKYLRAIIDLDGVTTSTVVPIAISLVGGLDFEAKTINSDEVK